MFISQFICKARLWNNLMYLVELLITYIHDFWSIFRKLNGNVLSLLFIANQRSWGKKIQW